MSIDLTPYKIEIFENINDKPVPPTATKPGNGPHLIKAYNDALAAIQASNDSASTAWQIVQGSASPAIGSKLACLNDGSNACSITLPTPRNEGDAIEVLNLSLPMTINLTSLPPEFAFWGGTTLGVSFSKPFETVVLIYSGSLGWISNKPVEDFVVSPGTAS